MFFLFDFDGVLIDSVREAGLSAYNAVTGSKAVTLEEMPKPCLDLFYNNRFIFYKPAYLYLLMQWCVENYQEQPDYILSKEEFQKYVEEEKRPLNELGAYFYSIRSAFMEAAPEKWVAINHPFQPVWNSLIKYGVDKFIILTAKNKKAVLKLGQHYGLEFLEENVYSGDGGKTKIDNFKEIFSRLGKQDFYFVDDHLVNLKDLDLALNKESEKLISLALCDWGYGWQGDFAEAKSRGYDILSQADLVKKFI